LTYNMTMKKVNIFELKAKLSEYVDLVEHGETLVVYRRNQPVAELRGMAAKRQTERPLGGMTLELTPGFFEPLPPEVEDAFYPAPPAGRGSMPAAARPPRVAIGPSRKARKR
jgi:antitoxin (DNA-binding transcriptional repressor) of toxin-antitoxin stability system